MRTLYILNTAVCSSSEPEETDILNITGPLKKCVIFVYVHVV